MERLNYLYQPWQLFFACRNAKIITVEPAIFLLMLARELYRPLYEQYYYVYYGSQLLENTSFPFPNGSFCLNSTEIDEYAGNNTYKSVETSSNNLLMYSLLADKIPSMFVTLVLGPLSDRFGRRFVILIPALGATLQSALSLCIIHFQLYPEYFILANFLSGVTGGFTGVLAGAFSYIADISSTKWRVFRIGVIEALLGIAAAIGQFVTGYWLFLINCDFIPPLWLTFSCNTGAIVYILLLVPESLTQKEREEMALKNPKGCGNVTKTFNILLGRVSKYQSTWKLWVSTLFIGVCIFAAYGSRTICVYFLKALPFDFDSLMIGYYQSAKSASRALCNIVFLPILLAAGVSDAAIALLGLLLYSLSSLLTGFAEKNYQVFSIVSFQGSEVLEITAGRTIMSKLVAPEDQGAIFAVIASCEALAAVLASVVWPIVFPLTLRHNLRTGTTFFLIAGVSLFGLPLIVSLLLSNQKETVRESNQEIIQREQSSWQCCNFFNSQRQGDQVSERSSLLGNQPKTTTMAINN